MTAWRSAGVTARDDALALPPGGFRDKVLAALDRESPAQDGTTPRTEPLPAVPSGRSDEDAFEARVRSFALEHGWRCYSRPRSRTPSPVTFVGWPDLCLWHPGRRLGMFVELKDQGRVSVEQANCLLELAGCFGATCRVWTPSMMDEIVAVLAGAA